MQQLLRVTCSIVAVIPRYVRIRLNSLVQSAAVEQSGTWRCSVPDTIDHSLDHTIDHLMRCAIVDSPRLICALGTT